MTRVGIISDTHGVLDDRVLAALEGCDVVVHGGDVGSAAVLRALESVVDEVIAVVGNNDVPRKWIGARRRLPVDARVDLPGGVLAVVHGDRVLPVARRHEKLRALYPDARMVVYGHSHHRIVDTSLRPWIANPGAAGRARTYGGPSLLILTATTRRWSVEEVAFAPRVRR